MYWPASILAALLQATPAPAPAPTPQRPPWSPADGVVIEYDLVPTIYFDWNSTRLRPEAIRLLNRAALAFRAQGQTGMRVTGHADRSGPTGYNLALSRRRAGAVADYLVRCGVPRGAITLDPKGDRLLLVETADNIRDERNRRSELYFQPGVAPWETLRLADALTTCVPE